MAFPNFATVGNGDDFTRANENPLAVNWMNFGGAGLAGGLKLVSNQALGSTTGFCGSLWKREEYSTSEIFCQYAVASAGVAKILKLRLTSPTTGTFPPADPAQNGYQISVDEISTDEWRITRIDNGVGTLLGAAVGATPIANGDQIGFEAVGSTITAYRKVGAGAWTAILSRVDATYPIGYLGIVTADPAVIMDNVGIGGATVGHMPDVRRMRFRSSHLRR